MARLGPLVRSDLSPFYQRERLTWRTDRDPVSQEEKVEALRMARHGLTQAEHDRAVEYLAARKRREEWVWMWVSWMA